jgi:hypothetical protein
MRYSIGVHVPTTSRDWRSTLISSLLSAIAVCCGLLSIGQSSAHVSSTAQGSYQWTAAEPPGTSIVSLGLPEWATTSHDSARVTADRLDPSGDSDDDDDGDNDDAPGAAIAPVPTTLTADRGHTHLASGQKIDRRLSSPSDGHSLRAPPQ